MRKIVNLIITLLLPIAVYSQGVIYSPNQQLIEMAVKNGILLTTQAYQLEDTASQQRFGRYGSEIFGKKIGLSFKTQDGIVFDEELLNPWDADGNFNRYRETHTPVLVNSKFEILSDTINTPFERNLSNNKEAGRSLRMTIDSIVNKDGFRIKRYVQPSECWLVWIVSDSTLQNASKQTKPSLIINKRIIEYCNDSTVYQIKEPQIQKQIWGGIVVIPEQEQVGSIVFNLVGVLLKDNNGWILSCINDKIVNSNESKISACREELTPLASPNNSRSEDKGTKKNKKSKKKTKNNG